MNDVEIFTYKVSSNSLEFEIESSIDKAIEYWENHLEIPFIYIDSGTPTLNFEYDSSKNILEYNFNHDMEMTSCFKIENCHQLHENDLSNDIINLMKNNLTYFLPDKDSNI